MLIEEAINRSMGPTYKLALVEIPTPKGVSADASLLAIAYPAITEDHKGTYQEKTLTRLLGSSFRERPDIDEVHKVFSRDTCVLFLDFPKGTPKEKVHELFLMHIEANWSRGRRVILNEVVNAWAADHHIVEQRHKLMSGNITIRAVMPPNKEIPHCVVNELSYLGSVDAPDTATRISRLLKMHGAIAVNYVRGETPTNEVKLAEEVRDWAMACSA